MSSPMSDLLIEVKPQRQWGWLIACYLFLGGSGAGLFFVSLWVSSRIGVILGLLLVGAGCLVLLFDLGRPERFWRAFCKPGSSWISRGTYLLTALLVAGSLTLWTQNAFLLVLSSLLALLVMLYTGFVLSPSPSIPFWNSLFLPVVFLIYSLMAGIAVLLGLSPWIGEMSVELRLLEGIQIGVLVATLAFILGHLSISSSAGEAARESVRLLTRGEFKGLFVGLVLVTGLVIPAILTLYVFIDEGMWLRWGILASAGVLKLVGDFVFRYAVLRVGIYDAVL